MVTIDKLSRCNKVHGGTGGFENDNERARMAHCLILIGNERSVKTVFLSRLLTCLTRRMTLNSDQWF